MRPTRDQTCPILLSHTPHWSSFSQRACWLMNNKMTLYSESFIIHDTLVELFSSMNHLLIFNTCSLEKRSYWLHSFGFSPVCILMWVLRLLLCVKALPHRLQLYGFYPECSLRCTLKLVFTWKLYRTCRVDMVSLQCVFSN